MNESVSYAAVAYALGGVVLAGGGVAVAWGRWVSLKLISFGEDMKLVKNKLKLNGRGG